MVIKRVINQFRTELALITFSLGTENARFVCEEHYALFKGPPIQLLCPKDLTFAYVPGHL